MLISLFRDKFSLKGRSAAKKVSFLKNRLFEFSRLWGPFALTLQSRKCQDWLGAVVVSEERGSGCFKSTNAEECVPKVGTGTT